MSVIKTTLLEFFSAQANRPIIVAYSGGVDSQVLLHALAALKQQQYLSQPLSVCYVNHGLCQQADQWQQSAQYICDELSLPLTVCQVSITTVAQKSLEAQLRDARYKALSEASPLNSMIVTGHHCDDQSETFLLALKRGSGLKGLSAMTAVNNLSKLLPKKLTISDSHRSKEQDIVRPLLKISRVQIIDYAHQHQLAWIEDESNQDTVFDRNFIRHEIMPLLKQRWPSILTTIKRSSEHCQEAELLLSEIAQQDLSQCQLTKMSLSVSKLKNLSQSRFNNLLRYFLETHGCLMPSVQQLCQVYLQFSAPSDKTPAVKVADHWLRRFQDALVLTENFDDISNFRYHFSADCFTAEQKQTIELPDQLGHLSLSMQTSQGYLSDIESQKMTMNNSFSIISPLPSQIVTIRFKHDNSRCLPDFRQHSRPLKKVLQELKIAPWQRKRIPYLYYDDHLVSAMGYFVCKEYIPQADQAILCVHWLGQI
jgi:tRNA(Ile)-lysidine synthase